MCSGEKFHSQCIFASARNTKTIVDCRWHSAFHYFTVGNMVRSLEHVLWNTIDGILILLVSSPTFCAVRCQWKMSEMSGWAVCVCVLRGSMHSARNTLASRTRNEKLFKWKKNQLFRRSVPIFRKVIFFSLSFVRALVASRASNRN